jgi:hypothetical protein
MKIIEGEFSIERWQVSYQPRQMLKLPAGSHILDIDTDDSSQPFLLLASPIRGGGRPPLPDRRILFVQRPFDAIPTHDPCEYIGKFKPKDSWELFLVFAAVLPVPR